MDDQEKGQEWLKALAERQIAARDPHEKVRQVSQKVASRRKTAYQKQNFFKDSLGDVPKKWWGVFYGAVFGLIVMFALPMFFDAGWIDVIAFAALPIFMILGFILGSSFDWRDDLRDL